MHKNVVSDALNAIFNAVYDLINYDKNIVLKFGFCNIYFKDKNFSYVYSGELRSTITSLMPTERKVKILFSFEEE